MGKYNGWANWETWNVALWLGNDEGLYNAVKAARPQGRILARDAEAIVRELLPAGTPDMDGAKSYGLVRWGEIATMIREA